MRMSVLAFWVLGLIAVIHYCVLGRVDVSSYLAGAVAVGMTLVISWDGNEE